MTGVRGMKLMKDKIPYEKPKVITCIDCLKYAVCPERSRMYPCRDFQGAKKKKES